MGSEELADNIFRIAQIDAKLKRDNVDNEYTANSVHYEVGREVRNSIKRLCGTMPEDLPTPEKSLKELEKEKNILDKYNISDIDVLKIGQHWSRTSSGKNFITEINPRYSIISVGKNNKYCHSNEEVLNN